jgi:hypothetical protein
MRARFALLVVLAALAGLPARADGPRILLDAYQFDPVVSVPGVPANLRAQTPAPGQAAYYIAQCTGPIKDSFKQQMQAQGARLVEYVPEYAFHVRATPEQAAAMRSLAFVRWVGLVQPAYKLEPGLLDRAGQVDVLLKAYPGESPAPIAGAASMLGAKVVDHSRRLGGLVRAQGPTPVIAALAGASTVSWIETWKPVALRNDVARRIMSVSFQAWERPGGYDVWKNNGLFGASQVVGVADTGLDTGDLATINPDFAGRVKALFTYSPDGRSWDVAGHGTHVCGSILGNGATSGSNPSGHQYTDSYAGVAPEAQLVFQRLEDDEGVWYLPADIYDVFDQAYSAGARIHSNSWGHAGIYRRYTVWAQSVDQFMWDHKDMLILFAAGNDGVDLDSPCSSLTAIPPVHVAEGKVDYGSIGSPATAKNCLSVGASESERAAGNVTYNSSSPTDFPERPISTDLQADDPKGLAAFSSRGPCSDNRTKPDIVAPGTWIVSVMSQVLSGVPWYMYESGTSMACPLTAGSAALVREYYQKIQGRSNPSAALIKATLMNCADEMAPGQYGVWDAHISVPTGTCSGGPLQEIAERPNNDEGWGRVNVGACIFDKTQGQGVWYREGSSTRGLFVTDRSPGLSTAQTIELWFTVLDTSAPFRATLVWTDHPGTPGTGKQLVNDLDLEVRATISSTQSMDFFGNGSRAVRYRDTQRDRTNNAEEVTLPNPYPGLYRVRVTGFNVPQGPQPFALVVSAPLANGLGISGTITEEAGFSIRDVQVRVYGRTGLLDITHTDSSGAYEFTGLSPGTYTVRPIPKIGQPGFAPTQQTITVPRGGGDAGGVDFVMTHGRTIKGWVGMPPWSLRYGTPFVYFEDVSNSPGYDFRPDLLIPIKDAVVTVAGATERATATTNASGYFEIGNLPAGTWTVTCSRPGWYFHPPTQTLILASRCWPVGEGGGGCVVLEDVWGYVWFSGGTPQPTYAIVGEVRTKTGRVLPWVTFNIRGAQHGDMGNVVSGSQGSYSRSGLLWDKYAITATMPGYLVHPIVQGGPVLWAQNSIQRLVFVLNVKQDWFAEDRGLALTKMTITGTPRMRQKSSITVTVQNVSRAAEQNITVTAYDNQAQIGSAKTISSLAGLTTQDLTFDWVPSTAGTHVVRAAVSRVQAEPYVGDNTRTMSVSVAP